MATDPSWTICQKCGEYEHDCRCSQTETAGGEQEQEHKLRLAARMNDLSRSLREVRRVLAGISEKNSAELWTIYTQKEAALAVEWHAFARALWEASAAAATDLATRGEDARKPPVPERAVPAEVAALADDLDRIAADMRRSGACWVSIHDAVGFLEETGRKLRALSESAATGGNEGGPTGRGPTEN